VCWKEKKVDIIGITVLHKVVGLVATVAVDDEESGSRSRSRWNKDLRQPLQGDRIAGPPILACCKSLRT